MTWEEFREAAVPHSDYEDTWWVDGDVRIHGEDALYEFYSTHIADVTPRAAAAIWNDIDLLRADHEISLSYCVSTHVDSFADPGEHAHVVDSMRAAAFEWERATDVNFIYMPDWDADCEAYDPDGPRFRVVKNSSNACQADAFGPSFLSNIPSAVHREITLSQQAVGDCHSGGLRKALTHELGHVIGLEHEHWRNDAQNILFGQGCDGQINVDEEHLSEFDWKSVMFYDHCGQGAGNTTVSRRDVAGVRFLYTLPKSGWLANRGGNLVAQNSNFDPVGTTDIFWHQADDADLDSFMIGLGQGVAHEASAKSVLGEKHRPILGNFDGDYESDILFYSDGEDELDALYLKQSGWGNFDWTAWQLDISGNYQPIVGNFLGTNRTDIFWYGPGDAPDMLWEFGRGAVHVEHPVDVGTSSDYYSAIPGDFDGDGDTDIFFYNNDDDSRRAQSLYLSSDGDGTFTTTGIAHANKGLTGDNTAGYFFSWATGDFNGDDKVDITFYAPGQPIKIWLGGPAGPGSSVVTKNIVGDFKLFAGDFNADSISDIFWYGQNASPSQIWRMDGLLNHVVIPQGPANEDSVPVLGDYNGDMRTDIYWHDPVGTDVLWRAAPGDLFWLDPVPQTIQGWPVGYSAQ